MTTKLALGSYPSGSSESDFECFGPPAIKDGEFKGTRICDMCCFDKGKIDSNKMYHGAVVQHTSTKEWYAYFQWGRVGASCPAFQFVQCRDEAEAANEYEKQLLSKNLKRGKWETIAGKQVLMPKKEGDSVYIVSPQATRSTGLPSAKCIRTNENTKVTVSPKVNTSAKRKIDNHTLKLMKDLSVGTIAYVKSSMANAALPTQAAIEEARDFVIAATKQLKKVGDDIDDQKADKDLFAISRQLYSRIPKKIAVGAPASEWVLTKDNILQWQQDLDAYESALASEDNEVHIESDPFGGMAIDMEWLDPKSELGKWLYDWWANASGNRHAGVGKMKIKNIWSVNRHDDDKKIPKAQAEVEDDIKTHRLVIKERPLYQPKERPDLSSNDVKKYKATNTGLLFHGTKTICVSSILRESFRFPKELVGVVITGAMFSGGGAGCYQADDFRKSVGYTSLRGSYYSAGSGGIAGREAFMFACDVVCGVPFVAPHAHPYTKPPDKTHCVFGKAGHSGVANNEWVIFKKHQCKIRYLCEFTTA